MKLLRVASGWFFRFSRWNLVIEEQPPAGGVIFVGAPHTSNWDLLLMLAISGQLGRRFHFLVKSNLFWWPLGPIMRLLGGIPVDRSSRQGLVNDLAERLKAEADFSLAITPKGTRGKRDYWRSGFYQIAELTGLPVQLSFVDSATNTAGVGPVIRVSGDVRADMERVRAFFDGKLGIRPELTCVPRLRREEEQAGS